MNRGPRIERQAPIVATTELTNRIERLERASRAPSTGATGAKLVQGGWTTGRTNTNGDFYITFPVPFGDGSYGMIVQATGVGTSNFVLQSGSVNGMWVRALDAAWQPRANLDVSVHWIAVGPAPR